jgi:hypothetical protein
MGAAQELELKRTASKTTPANLTVKPRFPRHMDMAILQNDAL